MSKRCVKLLWDTKTAGISIYINYPKITSLFFNILGAREIPDLSERPVEARYKSLCLQSFCSCINISCISPSTSPLQIFSVNPVLKDGNDANFRPYQSCFNTIGRQCSIAARTFKDLTNKVEKSEMSPATNLTRFIKEEQKHSNYHITKRCASKNDNKTTWHNSYLTLDIQKKP